MNASNMLGEVGAAMTRLRDSLQDHPWGVPSDIQIRQMKGGKVLSSPREYPQPDDGNQLMPPAFAKPITDRPSNVPQVWKRPCYFCRHRIGGRVLETGKFHRDCKIMHTPYAYTEIPTHGTRLASK